MRWRVRTILATWLFLVFSNRTRYVSIVPLDTLGNVVKGFDEKEIEKTKSLIFKAVSKEKEPSHVRTVVEKNTGTIKKTE